MNAPLRSPDVGAASGLQVFAFFHLNLAFSSIEEERRDAVIAHCYWPLLRLAGLDADRPFVSRDDEIHATWAVAGVLLMRLHLHPDPEARRVEDGPSDVQILAALRTARARGLVTIGFTGGKGAALRALCDLLFVSPSDITAVIQQIHLTYAHGICDEIEQTMMREAAKK